ncbi:MFS transporter [Flindersiella endophytica]
MAGELSLRAVGIRVYVPATLYGFGQGAIAPIIALAARDLGASVSTAGLIVAFLGLGQLVADVPAGALAARIGERKAMLAAGGLIAVALVLCWFAPSVWALGLGIFAIGLAGSVWMLARQAYIAEAVAPELRARALSTLGGVHRIGQFAGPFVGAAVVGLLGVRGPFLLFIAAVGIALIVLVGLPEPRGANSGDARRGSIKDVLRMGRDSFPVLRTLGLGVLMVGAVRASRNVVIPLWADHLGMDPAHTSLIFGVAGAVDMLLFYPSGLLMDRRGRNWVAVPSMALLGLAIALLPLTTGVAGLAAVAVLMGIGNGMGSGLVMTLGADLSPPGRRPEFLGAWRLCSDIGNGLGPVAISAVAAVFALWAGIAMMGVVGVVAATMLGYWIPRRIPGPKRAKPAVAADDQEGGGALPSRGDSGGSGSLA